jgi:hypothetical protein
MITILLQSFVSIIFDTLKIIAFFILFEVESIGNIDYSILAKIIMEFSNTGNVILNGNYLLYNVLVSIFIVVINYILNYKDFKNFYKQNNLLEVYKLNLLNMFKIK